MPVADGKSEMVPCACCVPLGLAESKQNFKLSLVCEGFSFVKCTVCGLVQRNPQPVQEEINFRYSDAFGNDYLSYELKNEDAFLKLQQLALKDAGFNKLEKELFTCANNDKPNVLDIGCATGALLAYLKDRQWRVTGVEISPCAKYAREERGLDVRDIPLEKIKFPSFSFDVVLASHLIEHLNNPRSFLTETHRILKDNGFCFITTPNISGFQAKLFGAGWRSAIFDHLYLFSIKTLSKLLKRTGFKIESVHTWGGLAAGTVPKCIKKPVDFLAKHLRFGDVMIIKAKKIN